MFTVPKLWLLVVLLIGAIACYGIGFPRGSFFIIIIGLLFEIGFWFGFFKSISSSDKKND